MARIKFKRGGQARVLTSLRGRIGLTWTELSDKINVHPRTLSDWRREKYTLPGSVFRRLVKMVADGDDIPEYKVLPDFWNVERAAKKGGRIIAEKYGGPGTPEGRKRGGINSQIRRRKYPNLYQHCNLRKEIRRPENNTKFAEFIGIILGDGAIGTDFQVCITLHRKNDAAYVPFITRLVRDLFDIEPAIYHYRSPRSKNVKGIVVSSANFIDFLKGRGLKRGNKVKNQVDVPPWIKKNTEFSKNCLRGLIDTDGGIYHHRHTSHGYNHWNIGIVFSNKSLPLLRFVRNTLLNFGFTPKISSNGNNIHLYRESEVLRYAQEIGFHNPHHSERMNTFMGRKYGKGAGVV